MHVGYVAKVVASTISMIGGNQSNAITNASFPRLKFLAFRWSTDLSIDRGVVSARRRRELVLLGADTFSAARAGAEYPSGEVR